MTRERAKELLQSFWIKFNNQPAPPQVKGTALESNTYTDFSLMTLMDFGLLSREDKSLDVLLAVIDHLFWESEAEVLEIVTSSPHLVSKAQRRGHLKAGKGVAYWFKTPPQWELPPDCMEIKNWHFTHFISDAFSFS